MSAPDWSLERYRGLCETLRSHYAPCTMATFLAGDSGPRPAAILRHDIDRFPADSLAMARLENGLGIRATYYVRMVPGVYSAGLVEALHGLDHEVGYHYEVLHKARGDIGAALARFADELAELRRHVPVVTATAHGSPLSPWDSLAIWEHARPGDFGLLGEPYLSIDYTRIAYYTDTGRSWRAEATNLRDRPHGESGDFPAAADTADLERLLAAAAVPALCLQTHPERWHDPGIGRLRSVALDGAANTAKRLLALAGRRRNRGPAQ